MADAGDYRCQASNIYQNKLYLSVSRMWLWQILGTTGARPVIFTRISCCTCLFLECCNGRYWGLQVSGQQYLPEQVVVFVCF